MAVGYKGLVGIQVQLRGEHLSRNIRARIAFLLIYDLFTCSEPCQLLPALGSQKITILKKEKGKKKKIKEERK